MIISGNTSCARLEVERMTEVEVKDEIKVNSSRTSALRIILLFLNLCKREKTGHSEHSM